MALEREGVELAIENLTGFLTGLNQAADAVQNLVVVSSVGASRTSQAQSEMMNIISQAAARVQELNTSQAAKVEQATNLIEAAYKQEETATNELVIVQQRAATTIVQAYDQEAKAAEDSARRITAADRAKYQAGLQVSGSTAIGGLSARGVNTGGAGEAQLLEAAIRQQAAAAEQAATSHGKKTDAIRQQSQTEEVGAQSGLRFVSVIAGIHAANSLVANSAFTTIGSIATLGYSFSGLGPAGAAAGVGIGVVLRAIETLNEAYTRIVQATETVIAALGRLALGALAAFAAFTAAGVKGSSDIQRNLALVQGITGATNQEMEALRQKVLEVSSTFGVSAEEISVAAQLYVKSGGDIAGAMNGALSAVAQLKTIAPNLGTEEATNALNALVNNFHIGTQQAADAIVQLSKTSTLSFSQIVQALRQIGPEASNLNIPLTDVNAALALLTQRGLTGTQAGTLLKQMFIDLAHPSAQAQEELNRVNISLFDQEGKIRPLPDLFADIARAYGQTSTAASQASDFERAYGLAVDFKSRAQIAANIIAQDGVEKFNALKKEQSDISALQLVALISQTTSFQFDRLQKQAQNVAIEFAGPLNTAIGSLLSKLNELFDTAGKAGVFKSLGEGLQVVLSGQGFSQFEENLKSITDNQQIISFVEGLLGLLLTLRQELVGVTAPAFENLKNVIAGVANNVNFTEFFSRIAGGAQAVVDILSSLIDRVSKFVGSLASGGPEAENLKSTLAGLATTIVTTLVGSLAASALAMNIVITVLKNIGTAVLEQIPNIDRFANAWQLAGVVIKDAIAGIARSISTQLYDSFEGFVRVEEAAHDALTGNFEGAQEALNRASEAFSKATADEKANSEISSKGRVAAIQQERDNIADLIRSRQSLSKALDDTQHAQGPVTDQQVNQIVEYQQQIANVDQELTKHKRVLDELSTQGGGLDALAALTSATTGAQQALSEIANSKPIDFSEIFANAQGDLDKTYAAVAAAKIKFDELFTPSTTAGTIIDPKKEQQAAEEATRIQERLADRIKEINLAAADQEANLTQQAIDRQKQIILSYNDSVENAYAAYYERIAQISANFYQQEQDKLGQKTVQRFLEDNIKGFEREHSVHEFYVQQDEQLERKKEERARQEQELTFNQGIALQEKQRQEGLQQADLLYTRAQALQNTTFSRQQQDSLKTFQESIDKETRLHNYQQELARAKTPQEQQQVTSRFTQSEQDRKFSEQQTEKLENFRRQQENQATSFRNSQEDAAFNRRIQQQLAEYNLKLQLDARERQFRQTLDNADFNADRARSQQKFQENQGYQDALQAAQRQNQDLGDTIQQGIDANRAQREINTANTTLNNSLRTAGTTAEKAQTALDDQLARDRIRNAEATNRQIQGLQDELVRTGTDALRKYGPSTALSNALERVIVTTELAKREIQDTEQEVSRLLTLEEVQDKITHPQEVAPTFTPDLVQASDAKDYLNSLGIDIDKLLSGQFKFTLQAPSSINTLNTNVDSLKTSFADLSGAVNLNTAASLLSTSSLNQDRNTFYSATGPFRYKGNSPFIEDAVAQVTKPAGPPVQPAQPSPGIVAQGVAAIGSSLIAFLNSPQYRNQLAQGVHDGLNLIGTLPVRNQNPTVIIPPSPPPVSSNPLSFRG